MKIEFVPKKFNKSSRVVIEQANVIIAEYRAQNFDLTLRQLYYQFVARGLIPNSQKSYKRIGSIVSDARLAGLISWSAIEDRTRYLQGLNTYDNPGEYLARKVYGYHVDFWADQPFAPEVWVEKEALSSVVSRACSKLRVDFFCCRGYASQSSVFSAGWHRFRDTGGRTPIVFHLGDHDPSGLDMTRDSEERLSLFAGRPIEVRRLALNMDQIEQYNPPPNPAKMSDSRAEAYVSEHGDESWELDALDPGTIASLIENAVTPLIDREAWRAAKRKEDRGRERLREVARELEDEDPDLEDEDPDLFEDM